MGKKWKKGEDEDRLRLRHNFLMQDYKQLWRETEAKKKRLIISTKKKLELLAEIKFLRRKLRSFSENPSQIKQFKLKIRYSDDMLSSLQLPILEEPANLREDFLDKIQEERESENAIIPQMFDLNQIYLAYNDDDTYKPMGSNMPPDDYLANGKSEISVKDAKLLKFRDAKNGANRVSLIRRPTPPPTTGSRHPPRELPRFRPREPGVRRRLQPGPTSESSVPRLLEKTKSKCLFAPYSLFRKKISCRAVRPHVAAPSDTAHRPPPRLDLLR